MGGGSSKPLRARVPVDLWITSLLPTGPTGQAGDLWTTSLLPTDPQPYRIVMIERQGEPGGWSRRASRSDLWKDGSRSRRLRAAGRLPRRAGPSRVLPMSLDRTPDPSILPNHRTFLICLDTENVFTIFRRTGWPVYLRCETGPRRSGGRPR